jgi:hypothetical protein
MWQGEESSGTNSFRQVNEQESGLWQGLILPWLSGKTEVLPPAHQL